MAAKFAKGDKVVQIISPIMGEVAGFQVDQTTGDVLILVQWVEDDGHASSRYFTEAELEAQASA